jgi:hypothetical protein
MRSGRLPMNDSDIPCLSLPDFLGVNRRDFLKGLSAGTVLAGGLVLGTPPVFGQEEEEKKSEGERRQPPAPKTNIDEFLKVPRAKGAIPGPFPGRVVEVRDPRSLVDDKVDAAVVREMLEQGITRLTGKGMKESFALLFRPDDVVGLKVNPVGPVINTRPEVTEAVIRWLVDSGLPKENVIIWDRFEFSLKQVGYTAENFPGVKIEALQVFDQGREPGAKHASEDRFDREAYYFAEGVSGKDVPRYKDDEFYLNQHVFNDEYSYFGKLLTKTLTKIVNLAAFKNTGNGISMATKNLGYGAICNTGRLHQPLFFTVCTEVLAAPWVRDKLVLNITDGLRGQYEGGPGFNAQFVYPNHALYFATDPFALDMVCHRELVAKRKEKKVRVDEHPRYTDYLHYGERLGLGIADPQKIEHVKVAG